MIDTHAHLDALDEDPAAAVGRARVAGVSRIQDNQLVVWLDNQRQQFCRDVPINPGELLYSTGHKVSVTY